jgi:hypothetical protein
MFSDNAIVKFSFLCQNRRALLSAVATKINFYSRVECSRVSFATIEKVRCSHGKSQLESPIVSQARKAQRDHVECHVQKDRSTLRRRTRAKSSRARLLERSETTCSGQTETQTMIMRDDQHTVEKPLGAMKLVALILFGDLFVVASVLAFVVVSVLRSCGIRA